MRSTPADPLHWLLGWLGVGRPAKKKKVTSESQGANTTLQSKLKDGTNSNCRDIRCCFRCLILYHLPQNCSINSRLNSWEELKAVEKGANKERIAKIQTGLAVKSVLQKEALPKPANASHGALWTYSSGLLSLWCKGTHASWKMGTDALTTYSQHTYEPFVLSPLSTWFSVPPFLYENLLYSWLFHIAFTYAWCHALCALGILGMPPA